MLQEEMQRGGGWTSKDVVIKVPENKKNEFYKSFNECLDIIRGKLISQDILKDIYEVNDNCYILNDYKIGTDAAKELIDKLLKTKTNIPVYKVVVNKDTTFNTIIENFKNYNNQYHNLSNNTTNKELFKIIDNRRQNKDELIAHLNNKLNNTNYFQLIHNNQENQEIFHNILFQILEKYLKDIFSKDNVTSIHTDLNNKINELKQKYNRKLFDDKFKESMTNLENYEISQPLKQNIFSMLRALQYLFR
jgi:hypothetical protein